jgi:Mrp family chromosome partitioning ATPase
LSRTFELLQRLEKEQELSVSAPPVTVAAPAVAAPANGDGRIKSVKVGEEEVLKLVQRVFRSSAPEAPRVVVFSGVAHGDGASWISTSAALTLAAQTTGSICVVDGNLRTPSLHHCFELENRFGLSDTIMQAGPIRNFTQQISGSNLWVLTCGQQGAAALSSEPLCGRHHLGSLCRRHRPGPAVKRHAPRSRTQS